METARCRAFVVAADTVRTVKGPVKSYSALDEQAIIEIYKLAE